MDKFTQPTFHQKYLYLEEIADSDCTCSNDETAEYCVSCRASQSLNNLSEDMQFAIFDINGMRTLRDIDFPDPCPDCGDKYRSCVCAWRRENDICPRCKQSVPIITDFTDGLITP